MRSTTAQPDQAGAAATHVAVESPAPSRPITHKTTARAAAQTPYMRRRPAEVAVAEDGEPGMTFGQTTVWCPRDAEYEPWNYSGSTPKVMAMAEGKFAVWTDVKRR